MKNEMDGYELNIKHQAAFRTAVNNFAEILGDHSKVRLTDKAAKEISKALPELIKAVQDEAFSAGFEAALDITAAHSRGEI